MCPVTYGFAVDNEYKSKKINSETVISKNETLYTWFHLNSGHTKAQKWLNDKSKLPSKIVESLLSNDSRPTILGFSEGTLISLRGVNTLPDGQLEDFNSINIWIEKNRIISIRNHRILAIEEISKSFDEHTPPKSVSEFITLLISKMNHNIGDVITKIEDECDIIDDNINLPNSNETREDITLLRKRIVKIRRYIIPQRDVLQKLSYNDFDWIDQKCKIDLRYSYEKLLHFIEDIDLLKDNLILSQEEISNQMNEEMNKTMYRLSIVSILFLPLGFLTGLFGINIGGMPGNSNNNAFMIFTIICISFLLLGYSYLKYKKKI